MCAITVVMLAFAGSAFGKIWETPEQVITRSKRNKEIIAVRWDKELPMLYVHYRDGALVTHVFGTNGRCLATFSYLPKRPDTQDIGEFQRLYSTKWRSAGPQAWESHNSIGMILQHYETFDLLCIGDTNKEQEMVRFAALLKEQNAPKAVPVAPEITKDKKDCLIVATEMQARLRGSAQWSRIAAFSWKVDGKRYGHAAVFYQPDVNANVFLYDKGLGSVDLGTQTHELPELLSALNGLYGVGAQSPRWIGGN